MTTTDKLRRSTDITKQLEEAGIVLAMLALHERDAQLVKHAAERLLSLFKQRNNELKGKKD